MIIGIDMYPPLIFKTGVRVVVDNLVAALRQQFPEHTFVELRPARGPLPTSRHSYGRKIWNHLQRIAWTQLLPWYAKQHRCDVLFCTCYFSPFVQVVPTVTLFYDLAIWLEPERYNRLWVLMNKLFAQLPARWNSHIMTISEDARKDIIAVFGVSPERVTKAYLGVDLPAGPPDHDRETLQQYGIPADAEYVLYMGPAIPHKNLPRLVAAFEQVVRRLPDRKLLLVIGGPGSNLHGKDNLGAIHAAIEQHGIADRVRFTGFVPREHCAVLYRNAAVYCFPSLFEGFGLPMIEAMASGTPVVSSNRAALPEIGGDVALYFDPLNVPDIADSLYSVLTRLELRQAMIRRGKERAAMFTWHTMAATYMQIFQQVAPGVPFRSEDLPVK
jgi:glycosyltransferase involved in cell wall biosynthesis